MAEGAAHAAIVTFLPMAALGAGGVLPEGRGVGLWGYGLVVFFCVVVVANGRLAMENKLWTVLFVSLLALSLILFVLFWFFFAEMYVPFPGTWNARNHRLVIHLLIYTYCAALLFFLNGGYIR